MQAQIISSIMLSKISFNLMLISFSLSLTQLTVDDPLTGDN